MTFPRLINLQELGQSLKEVSTDLIATQNEDVISRWFHSAQDVDFYIWLDQRHHVLKQQLTFLGQVVEWNVVEGIKTGLIIEQEGHAGQRGSEIIQFDDRPQAQPIEQARILLQAVAGLSTSERTELVQNLHESSRLGTAMPAHVFVERFGRHLPAQSQRQKQPLSFWARLKRRFSAR